MLRFTSGAMGFLSLSAASPGASKGCTASASGAPDALYAAISRFTCALTFFS